MASGENVLWVVRKQLYHTLRYSQSWVFRTREAAKEYAKTRTKKSKVAWFVVQRATWGPEQ
jgi:hypothetical protein